MHWRTFRRLEALDEHLGSRYRQERYALTPFQLMEFHTISQSVAAMRDFDPFSKSEAGEILIPVAFFSWAGSTSQLGHCPVIKQRA